MYDSQSEDDYPIPSELEEALGDPALPLSDRTNWRHDIEEHVLRRIKEGKTERIEPFYRQMTLDIRKEAAKCRTARRLDISLQVVQRVAIPAATSVGVLLLQAHGFG